MKIKKISNIITALIVLIFTISFLTMTIFRKKGSLSYQENRQLSNFPQITLSSISDGSFFKQFNNYFTDQFAFRSRWISASGTLNAEICESIVNDVYINENIMLDISVPNIDNSEYKKIADEINKFADSYDGSVCFAIIPTSTGIYGNFLPEHLEDYNTEKQRIDALYSQLNTSIRKIDAYNILKMLNNNYIYYRNDSKWTSYGAYCVYRTVIQKLGFLPVAYDKYTIEHISGDFKGELYNKTQYSNLKADILDIYNYSDGAEILSCTGYNENGQSFDKQLYDKAFIDTNDMYKLYLGEETPLIKIKTSVNNERKLLIIKDEYANCFIPFLTQHYSEISIVSPKIAEGKISELINVNDYEQVLILYGVSNINSSSEFEMINK